MYGWGVAVLDTAENCWGEDLCQGAYHKTPEESLECIIDKLSLTLPNCDRTTIMKLIKA